jgi:Trypsin-like serine proteases, typically periplasmic, contain C-terminal PDZ domain
MNGKKMASFQVFKSAVAAIVPGTPVTLQIQREGRLMFVSFTLE